MITIFLKNHNQFDTKELYCIDKKRLATATGVSFIDDKNIAICSLVGAKIYLYQLNDNEKFELLDEIDTTYNNNLTSADLIDYHPSGLLVASNFGPGTQTLYKIKDNKIEHYKDVKNLNLRKSYCHGVKFYSNQIICATSNKKYKIDFINFVNDTIIYTIKCDGCNQNINDFNPKDVDFINKNKMLAIFTTLNIFDSEIHPNAITKIVLYDINIDKKTHTILDEFIINNSHSDSIKYYNQYIYVNNQITNKIDVLLLSGDKISYHKSICGFDFPHAIAIEPTTNLLAVSNYGNNSVNILDINNQ